MRRHTRNTLKMSILGRSRLKRSLLAAMLCAYAAACSSSDDQGAYTCPRAAVIADAVTLTQFKPGAGGDPIDVDFTTEISDLSSGCQFKQISEDKYDLVVAVAPVLNTTRGPANEDREAQFTYFVSLVGPDQSILVKQPFDQVISFIGNQRRVQTRLNDPPITIDIPDIIPTTAINYEILIGMQLTPEQLEYNRRKQQVLR